MKCGREIALGQVFCKECLADMDQYPIAPGTPVPMFEVNPVAAPKRNNPTRKQKKPEDQVVTLKRWIVALSLMLMVTIMGFAVVAGGLLHRLQEAEKGNTAEQNYSTMDTAR